jgi:DNA-directed RNA polymerase subunit RPC12/RpoP
MKIPALTCEHCGGRDIRRARVQSWSERIQGLVGIYPFRCRECQRRFQLSIWLLSKLHYAKCPKCLRMDLSTWSRKYYRAGMWASFLVTFGAQKYRCTACRCNFVSFRPRKCGASKPEADADPGALVDHTI